MCCVLKWWIRCPLSPCGRVYPGCLSQSVPTGSSLVHMKLLQMHVNTRTRLNECRTFSGFHSECITIKGTTQVVGTDQIDKWINDDQPCFLFETPPPPDTHTIVILASSLLVDRLTSSTLLSLQRGRNIQADWLSAFFFLSCLLFPVNSAITLDTTFLTWRPCSMFNAVCFIFLPHFLIQKFMMTFSTFHKIFINVITNNFHRSSKLILLSAFICAAQHGSISLGGETSCSHVWLCIDTREKMFRCVCVCVYSCIWDHVCVRFAWMMLQMYWQIWEFSSLMHHQSERVVSHLRLLMCIRHWSPLFPPHYRCICSFPPHRGGRVPWWRSLSVVKSGLNPIFWVCLSRINNLREKFLKHKISIQS